MNDVPLSEYEDSIQYQDTSHKSTSNEIYIITDDAFLINAIFYGHVPTTLNGKHKHNQQDERSKIYWETFFIFINDSYVTNHVIRKSCRP